MHQTSENRPVLNGKSKCFGNGLELLKHLLSSVQILNSQFSGLFGQAFGQCGQTLVAAAHHGIQTGTLCWTPQHRRTAVLIIT